MNPGKKSKTRDRDRARFTEKIQSVALNHLYMFLCFGIFFRKSRSVTVPKISIYFYSNCHISHHNGICHFKLASQDSLTDTLSAHIIFIFLTLVLTVTSQAIILDFFQKARSVMVPKIHGYLPVWNQFQILLIWYDDYIHCTRRSNIWYDIMKIGWYVVQWNSNDMVLQLPYFQLPCKSSALVSLDSDHIRINNVGPPVKKFKSGELVELSSSLEPDRNRTKMDQFGPKGPRTNKSGDHC